MIDIKARLLIFALFWLFSCHHGFVVRSETPIDNREADSVLCKLGSKKASSLRLIASSKLDSKEKRVFFKQAVLAKKTGSICMTAEKFGSPFFHISLEKNKVVAFAPGSGEYFFGGDADRVFESLIGIDIGFKDVLGVLFGGAFIPEEYRIERASLLNGRHYRIVILESGGLKRQYTVDGKNMTLTDLVIIQGPAELRVGMSKYRKLNDVLYPFSINMRREHPYAELDMKIEKIDFDPLLKEQVFDIHVPNGTTPLAIEDLNMF